MATCLCRERSLSEAPIKFSKRVLCAKRKTLDMTPNVLQKGKFRDCPLKPLVPRADVRRLNAAVTGCKIVCGSNSNEKNISQMTLFELAYACRLFGKDDAYDTLRQKLGQNPVLDSASQQAKSLLTFLNKWGCRIPKADFPLLIQNLQQWASNWLLLLPAADRDIRSLTGSEREQAAKSYDDALLNIGPRFKETAIAKTLHALRPHTLPMWDAKIKDWFIKKGWFLTIRASTQSSTGQIYAAFIRYVAEEELSTLENDANRLGYSLTDIPQLVEKPNYSLVKLVDEYYWITKTREYTFPTRTELQQWLRWI